MVHVIPSKKVFKNVLLNKMQILMDLRRVKSSAKAGTEDTSS